MAAQAPSLTDINTKVLYYGVPHTVLANKAPCMGWLCCLPL